MIKKILKYSVLVSFVVLLIGLVIPQNLKMPIVGAGNRDYNHKTFW